MVVVTGLSSPVAATAGSSSSVQPSGAISFSRSWKEVRARYDFGIAGYVVMPEHFHLLITEPKQRTLPLVMQVLKQRISRAGRKISTSTHNGNMKHTEKQRYIHRNPVKRGLVKSPELWRWSCFRQYRFGEPGPVKIV